MKSIKLRIKQFLCPHAEWDCDKQIRTIECRGCGKRAWIRDYKDLYSTYNKK